MRRSLLPQHVDTSVVHAGALVMPSNPASSPPLFQASSYEFTGLDEIAAIYDGAVPGAIYGRYGGPNAGQFETAVAQLEGAEAAVGAASGMAAIDAALAPVLRAGGTIVATREIYGGTFDLFEREYRPRGFGIEYVDQTDIEAVRVALGTHRPKVLYVEALTNPLVHVADLPALGEVAREAGALLVVDATFASPVLIRPLALGADLVLHSVGKYLGGHGDVGAGIVSGSDALIGRARAFLVRTGATLPHFEAWLALRGLRTLALRMERHSQNAAAVAAFLAAAAQVRAVYHPSLPAHPQWALARRLYPGGTGGIVAFSLDGGAPEVDRLLRALRTIAIVHSLGEVATTISYPRVSSHRSFTPAERLAAGVDDGTLRLSVGIEHPADIIADLEGALAALSD